MDKVIDFIDRHGVGVVIGVIILWLAVVVFFVWVIVSIVHAIQKP